MRNSAFNLNLKYIELVPVYYYSKDIKLIISHITVGRMSLEEAVQKMEIEATKSGLGLERNPDINTTKYMRLIERKEQTTEKKWQ